MRILFGKTFGLGNAVMSVPAIKALATLGQVDVLIGSTPDDGGAYDVFSSLRECYGCIGSIYVDRAPQSTVYDVAVMAIPYDGRWVQGQDYRAHRTIDTRPRPDFSPHLGFDSWKKHEAEYQLDDARELGWAGETPSSAFYRTSVVPSPRTVYLGLGFKRDRNTFWSQKHWGNERYVQFIRECVEIDPTVKFKTTGNQTDLVQVGAPIVREVGDLLRFDVQPISHSFDVVQRCSAYFGNDTGMMHVAASMGKPVYAMRVFPGSERKNHPLCDRWTFEPFHEDPRDPRLVARDFMASIEGVP